MTDIERRLERIEALLEHMSRQLGCVQSPPIPDVVSQGTARIMALARQDREAAIQEAKRLSRMDTIRRREERRRAKC